MLDMFGVVGRVTDAIALLQSPTQLQRHISLDLPPLRIERMFILRVFDLSENGKIDVAMKRRKPRGKGGRRATI